MQNQQPRQRSKGVKRGAEDSVRSQLDQLLDCLDRAPKLPWDQVDKALASGDVPCDWTHLVHSLCDGNSNSKRVVLSAGWMSTSGGVFVIPSSLIGLWRVCAAVKRVLVDISFNASADFIDQAHRIACLRDTVQLLVSRLGVSPCDIDVCVRCTDLANRPEFNRVMGCLLSGYGVTCFTTEYAEELRGTEIVGRSEVISADAAMRPIVHNATVLARMPEDLSVLIDSIYYYGPPGKTGWFPLGSGAWVHLVVKCDFLVQPPGGSYLATPQYFSRFLGVGDWTAVQSLTFDHFWEQTATLVMPMLAQHCPNLHTLDIRLFETRKTVEFPRASGMPNLRILKVFAAWDIDSDDSSVPWYYEVTGLKNLLSYFSASTPNLSDLRLRFARDLFAIRVPHIEHAENCESLDRCITRFDSVTQLTVACPSLTLDRTLDLPSDETIKAYFKMKSLVKLVATSLSDFGELPLELSVKVDSKRRAAARMWSSLCFAVSFARANRGSKLLTSFLAISTLIPFPVFD